MRFRLQKDCTMIIKLDYIFKFAAQFFLVQFGLKLFFRDHLSNFASLLQFNSMFARLFRFQCLTRQDRFRFDVQFLCLGLKNSRVFNSFHAKVFSFNWSLESLLGLGLLRADSPVNAPSPDYVQHVLLITLIEQLLFNNRGQNICEIKVQKCAIVDINQNNVNFTI
ncbi:Hypothetical_protein [Hexamita inflata]|uniref:Hypothetical_protein n=1 Tax=Hexamita inflata TaxID=28002 RepID=A0AA86R157_9EUKA|nr:Hypothetical protein HINF_LOCUS57439 [Hexamita inflata]